MMVKRLMVLVSIVLTTVSMLAQSVTIDDAAGWLESAYVKWQPGENADSYNVYYSGEGITDQQIDPQLIRDYGSYFRADVLGLKAGSYTLKIVPVISDVEGEVTQTAALTVLAHDRTGFSFSNGRVPGAYKADGTLKDNAVVLYITENTKDKVSLEVTGANENPCVGLETILEGFKKGDDNRPLVLRLVGQITDPAYLDKGDIVIENDNNAAGYITLEGVGDDAVADGWGIRVKNASNIEIRNIGLMNCNSDEGDDIGLQQNNDYVWVHHCDFFYGDAGSDSDQAKGDGALDCKKSTYVTFSYNHFWDTGKSNLLGLSEGTTQGLFITYHHNWYDHSDSRHPRVRYYSAHVYNNYYDGIAKYGVGSTLGSSVFVEGNYFRHCKYPMLTSMQGSDVYDESTQSNDYSDMPTFSKEDGGTIKAFNNYMEGQRRFVPYGDAGYPNSTVDFDAYVATTRDETVPATVKSSYGSNTYNNFDTNSSVMYAYTAETPADARNTVMQWAGRVNGGDFKWTFNNAVDDQSYAVNTALKAALTGYETTLVAVQGDSIATGGTGGGTGEITGDVVHNFTLSGLSSEFFDITGTLSATKGTVTYGGLTLTQCLKIESSTSVSFTIAEDATLVLVFNEGFSGEININGTAYAISNGVMTATLTAGTYEITKVDVANLYLMSLEFASAIQHPNAVNVQLYPNPVSTALNIASDAEVQNVEIYSLSGQLINDISGNVKTLDVSQLNQGTYLIKVYTGKGIFRQTILKK
ncbi:T9SS type A sorting domain-containing protein [Saccharicrinis sp. FJH62]|uniref:pectate lyase family protein n=1 Tax=Saccharicrinis sp. FJH62 TaxID=3344657 RepID=UPI0035D3FF77